MELAGDAQLFNSTDVYRLWELDAAGYGVSQAILDQIEQQQIGLATCSEHWSPPVLRQQLKSMYVRVDWIHLPDRPCPLAVYVPLNCAAALSRQGDGSLRSEPW